MKKYILYGSVFTTLAFIVYGIKTVVDSDTLKREFWLTGIMPLGTQVSFYLQYREENK